MDRRQVLMFTIYLGVVFALEPPSKSKQYRTDYQYNRDTDSFYKLHVQLKNYADAKRTCINEGAELMIPTSQFDVMQFQQMFKNDSCYGKKAWIGLDYIYPTTEEEFVTEDPVSVSESDIESLHTAMKSNGDIIAVFEMRELPFICKVKADDAPFNSDCDVYGKGYEYNAIVGSCYKLSKSKFYTSWFQAYSECQHEGSHLVILNSETEHQVVWDLSKKYRDPLYLSAGFRAKRTFGGPPRVFKTIFGETLEEAGYNKWSETEPNNLADNEYCGSIYSVDGKLNDIPCHGRDYHYICEKEVFVLANSLK